MPPDCFVVTFRRGDIVVGTEQVFADRESRAVIKATVRRLDLDLDDLSVDVALVKRSGYAGPSRAVQPERPQRHFSAFPFPHADRISSFIPRHERDAG